MSDVQHIINLPERFDFGFHKQFTDQYMGLLSDRDCKQIILDFYRVVYLDSSALGMMVLLQKKAKANNIKTSIRGAKGVAADILQMANVQLLFDFI
jgi:HptB-dependent secretion and biofilm anti anti-sigma factor